MKKQRKQALILLVVLLIVTGLYFLFEKVINPALTEDEEEINYLWSVTKDSVSEISFMGADELLSFKKTEDGAWKLKGYEEYDINSSSVETLIGYIRQIKLDSEVIGETDNLSDYGLESPTNIITFVSDGTTYTLKLGDYNSYLNGYYILSSKDNNVYIWSRDESLSFNEKTFEDFIVTEEETNEDSSSEDVSSDDVSATE